MASSDGDDFPADGEGHRKPRTKPYGEGRPIPNIKRYHERQQARRQEEDQQQSGDGPRFDTDFSGEAVNRNTEDPGSADQGGESQDGKDGQDGQEEDSGSKLADTSEVAASGSDPRAKRKALKKRDTVKDRNITDPVTHLQSTIHDFTQKELKDAPYSLDPDDSQQVTNGTKSHETLQEEQRTIQSGDRATRQLFPPPSFDYLQQDLAGIYGAAVRYGLAAQVVAAAVLMTVGMTVAPHIPYVPNAFVACCFVAMSALFGGLMTWLVSGWMSKKTEEVWNDHLWQAAAEQEDENRDDAPESTMWLNHFLKSVWPLINPDLFTSIADMLEDVMQASLPPKLIRMVAVADLGQGAVAPRIIGARWLPSGAAGENVSADGKTQGSGGKNDRQDPDNQQSDTGGTTIDGEQSGSKDVNHENDTAEEQNEENMNEGLEAESGDFVNLELVLAYRPSKERDFKSKAQNAHLFLDFYLPGSIPVPVFVSLRGFICRVRMRMQLTPDPPFINLLTFTLMGQPKVDISCVPITKHAVSLTDIPLISSFVSSSIDAALSEYVSPRSLTLNMKQMLSGDDFKKNTEAKGIVVVHIKRGYDFKEADTGMLGMSKASTDAYVSAGWAKFGKALWSTRVILQDMHPEWQETAFIPLGTEEINADESLRVQLWDSDRMSADDDLGRIEVPLKELMSKWKGEMYDRRDGFISMDADEKMPGTLEWRVGYFEKLPITQEQLEAQQIEPSTRSVQQLKDSVAQNVANKLRETGRDTSDEAEQQKAQDFEERADALISAAPPQEGYPSGILSVQIHNITGLTFMALQRDRKGEGDDYSEGDGEAEDLPSSYATIVLNNKTIYKTRTKPKNTKPFFNAGTERFIRDWQNTEVAVTVRDSRPHENDPLMGFVYLPLEHILKKQSQSNEIYPLSGGAGHGRVRISMVFRSIELKLPKELMGWDLGTLEIAGAITGNGLPSQLQGASISAKTRHGKGKLRHSDDKGWVAKRDRTIWLATTSRYSANVMFTFRTKQQLGGKTTAAFAIFWLKDLPDDEKREVELSVYHGKENMKRAQANCVEDLGEKLGTITVPLRFWPGLSDYHKPLAKNDPEISRVIELNEAAGDQLEKNRSVPEEDGDGSSSSSDDSDDGAGLEEDGKRGPLSELKEYKKHHQILHRQNRGVMQWKAARTNNWVLKKAQRGIGKIAQNPFQHHDREPGIETEV